MKEKKRKKKRVIPGFGLSFGITIAMLGFIVVIPLCANGWTIFWKVTFPHIKWPLLYGIVLCTARAMGEFGAVSVLSGHLRGRTNTMPLYIELLYQGYDFTGAFAVSAILVLMAVIILVLRSVLEYKGQQAAKAEKGQQEG